MKLKYDDNDSQIIMIFGDHYGKIRPSLSELSRYGVFTYMDILPRELAF